VGDLATRADCAEVLDALDALRIPDRRRADSMLDLLRAFRLIESSRKVLNEVKP
jgi:hypothetical protein